MTDHPTDDDTLDADRRIDAICMRFERSWERGGKVRIEDFLDGLDTGLHGRLLCELIPIDIELRSRAGERPTATEYLARFPKSAAAIEQAIADSLPADSRTEALHPRHAPKEPVESTSNPRSIGSYSLLAELGRGGQGTVHLAHDTRLQRKVALKILRHLGPGSEEAVLRFRREAELLARLDHPGICSVHDAGVREGVAYIAMQYVDGQTLAQRIDEVRANSRATVPNSTATASEITEVLRIIESISRALHAAHEAGIVHRDIKPGNIMLGRDGQPVILDFGLSRGDDTTVETLTHAGDVFGTPAYMSPEQIRADGRPLDPRTDVYSLGVLMFEWLTLKRPFDAARRETLYRSILTDEPPSVRKINRAISQDLAIIVATAMEKDPDRRYQTALALAEDLRRARQHLPIHARPITRLVRVRRWAQRNPGVAASLTLAFATLIAATVFSTHQFFVADAARLESVREADKARAVNLFLNDMLAEANPKNNPEGRQMTVPEMLDRAAENIASSFAGQPEIEAGVRSTIGAAFRVLGSLDKAEEHLATALAIHRDLFGSRHEDVFRSLNALGSVAYRKAEYDRAESLFREALSIGREILGTEDAAVAQTLGSLGAVLEAKHEREEAEPILREGLRIAENALGIDQLDVAEIADQLAALLWSKRDYDGAEKLFRRSLAIRRRHLGNDHPSVAQSLNSVAVVLRAKGQLGEAITFYRRAMEVGRRVYGEEHFFIATMLNNLARALHYNGDLEAAGKHYREALSMRRRLLGKDHPEVADAALNLAELLMLQEDYHGAEPLCREGLAIDEKNFGSEHPLVAMRIRDLGRVKHGQGEYSEGVALYRRAARIFRDFHGDEHHEVASTLILLGEGLQDSGDARAAESPVREALRISRKFYGPRHSAVASCLAALGSILLDLGQLPPAERALRDGLGIMADRPGDSQITGVLRGHLGRYLIEVGRYDEAERELLESHRVLEVVRGSEPSEIRLVVAGLVELYEAWSKPQEEAHWRAKLLR